MNEVRKKACAARWFPAVMQQKNYRPQLPLLVQVHLRRVLNRGCKCASGGLYVSQINLSGVQLCLRCQIKWSKEIERNMVCLLLLAGFIWWIY